MSQALRVYDGGFEEDAVATRYERQDLWEQHVLATMLSSDSVWRARLSDVGIEDFVSPRHAEIFAAMLEMKAALEPTDTSVLIDRLTESGYDARHHMASVFDELCDLKWTVSNADYYATKLRELTRIRQIEDAADEVARLLSDTTLTDSTRIDRINEASKRLKPKQVGQSHAVPLSQLCREVMDQVDSLVEDGVVPQGLETGFWDVDRLLGAVEPESLTVIGARSSVGKTAFALSLAKSFIEAGCATLFCSLEMPAKNIAKRLLVMESGIGRRVFRDAEFASQNHRAVGTALEHYYELPLTVDDRASMTVEQIRSEAVKVQGLGAIIVDYLQIMGGNDKGQNTNERITQWLIGLREIAKSLKVPIFVLSQLNRELEKREEKRPTLSDLRDSGSIEAEANAVILLYRPEYHKRLKDPSKFRASDIEPCEAIIAKNRDGDTGIAIIGYQAKFARFVNLPPESVAAYKKGLEG